MHFSYSSGFFLGGEGRELSKKSKYILMVKLVNQVKPPLSGHRKCKAKVAACWRSDHAGVGKALTGAGALSNARLIETQSSSLSVVDSNFTLQLVSIALYNSAST